MKALIIGANGQDGRIISKQLVNKGYEVIGVTRANTESTSIGITKIKLDISVNSNCQEILNRHKPDYIYHVGAIHGSALRQESVIAQSESEMLKCHVDITKNVLLWLQKNETSKLHVALSSQIFSPDESVTSINEKTIPKPQNFYGETKLEAWKLLQEHRSRFGPNANGSILFNHSSEYSSKQFLFPTIVTRLIQTNFAGIEELGLKNPWGFIDISDAREICSVMIASLETKPGEDFILGQGKLVEIGDLINQIVRRFEPTHKQKNSFQEHNVSRSNPVLVSDISKAIRLLHWRPQTEPAELLARMVKVELSKLNNRNA